MKQVLIDRYGTPWDVARCATFHLGFASLLHDYISSGLSPSIESRSSVTAR